jgi:hypothetical protein
MTRLVKYLVLLLLSGAFYAQGVSAQKAQQVSKSWSGEFEWKENSKLFLNGEQATITISSYEGKVLRCEVTRTALHPIKDQARKDLEQLKLLADESGNKITLRNYVELKGRNGKPASKLKTTYRIKIPKNAKGEVEIWNYFGDVSIEKLNCQLSLKLEFTNLTMNDFSGEAAVRSQYGDAQVYNLSGKLDFEANRSDLELRYLKGSATVEAEYAELRLLNLYNPDNLSIVAERSEVFIDIPSKTQLGYKISTTNVSVNHPSGKKLEKVAGDKGEVRFEYTPSDALNYAQISLNTGTINYIVQ